MKKVFFLTLSFWILVIATSINAQVTIGKNANPHAGAILDLSQSNKELGLLLPNISLGDVNVFQVVDAKASDIATQKISAKGMVVYNTSGATAGGSGIGLYTWDGARWRALSINGGSMTISPSTSSPIPATGGNTGTLTVASPAADGFAGDYTFVVISGDAYAEVNPSAASDGKFSINFHPNTSALPRKAVVLVTDPAGNTATFIFSQEANTSLCANSGSHDPAVTQTGDLGAQGAVYFSITTEASADYVWTRNGVQVATGATYIATQPGNYVVYGGAVGCTYKKDIVLTSAGTAPDPVVSVVSSNGGVVCGGNTVKLTALGVPVGSTIAWFKNGVWLSEGTSTSIEVNAIGNYFVALKSGNLYSQPSNISTVASGGGSSQVPLTPADVKVNGTAIHNFNSYCKGSSLYLTVDNPAAGITYTWYNGNDEIVNTNPYIVPTTQDHILLRLVATDNSGSLCPAEANSTDKTISSFAPAAASILGADLLCSGQSIRLTATGADNAASFEWYKDDALVSSGADNFYDVSTPGSYRVRYAQSGGCMSNLSAAFVVKAQGAPVIEWDQFVTQVNNTSTYTFSVRSTGSSTPTSYIWDATANGVTTQNLSSETGNTVHLLFTGTSGSITLTVKPMNGCGEGSPVTKEVKMIDMKLSAPTVTPASGTYCGGVNFKIEKPADWTAAQWSAFSASNITSATLGGTAYSGTLTSDGTAYYYYIKANKATVQAASLTVGGQIGAIQVIPVTVTAQVQTSTASAFTGTGTTCFDINYSNVAGRTKADFTQNYTYSLSGTLGGASISNVTWSYKNSKNAVQVFTPEATSSTVTSNRVVVKYDPALLNDASIDAGGILVIITATITTTGGSCPIAVYTVEIPVGIKNAACCEGAIIANGAYNNYTTASTGELNGSSSSWTFNDRFTAKGKDLCWNKSDASSSATNWNIISCTGEWRLPNLRELHELYIAMGGSGVAAATSFSNLKTPNSNPGKANDMVSGRYWSGTEFGSNAYFFYFNNGTRNSGGKTQVPSYVRCVREL